MNAIDTDSFVQKLKDYDEAFDFTQRMLHRQWF